MKKPITWNEDTFYNRIGISEYEAKSIIDPKKINDSEIKPEEELDFEDEEDNGDCTDYDYDYEGLRNKK